MARQTARHGGVFERKTVAELAAQHVRTIHPTVEKVKKVRQRHHHAKKPRKGKMSRQGVAQPLIHGE